MKKKMKRAERLDLSALAFVAMAGVFLAMVGVSLFSDAVVWLTLREEHGLKFWADVFSSRQISLFAGLSVAAGLASVLFYRRSRRPAKGIYYREVAGADVAHPSLVRRRAVI